MDQGSSLSMSMPYYLQKLSSRAWDSIWKRFDLKILGLKPSEVGYISIVEIDYMFFLYRY